jgi:hypothetical protein
MTNTNTYFLGTLCMRKRRGRKLTFMVGGGFDSLAQLQSAIRWDASKPGEFVFEFHGAEVSTKDAKLDPVDAAPFSLIRPTQV